MAVSLRETVTGSASGTAASVNIGAGTLSTDLLVAIGYSDFFSLGTFGPPSGGGWTQQVTADLGTDNSKIRVWTKTAAGGSATITLAPILDEDVGLAVLVLAGADTADPVDAAAGNTSTGGGPPSLHVAPSVSPSNADAYLVCSAGTSVFNGGAAYTSPGSMTERAEFSLPGNAMTCVVATEQLATSGATGTRTFEYGGTNDDGLAVSVAITTASTGVTGTLAVTEAADTLTSSGTSGVSGSAAVTEAADTLAGSGTHTPPAFTGTVAVTEAADALAASGSHTPPSFTGTLSVTEQGDTLAGAGTATPPAFIGTLAVAEEADQLAASGTGGTITGTISVAEVADLLTSAGSYAMPPSPSGWGRVVTRQDLAVGAVLERQRSRLVCPNDGTSYQTGPRGELYCPFDGFKPDRGW